MFLFFRYICFHKLLLWQALKQKLKIINTQFVSLFNLLIDFLHGVPEKLFDTFITILISEQVKKTITTKQGNKQK